MAADKLTIKFVSLTYGIHICVKPLAAVAPEGAQVIWTFSYCGCYDLKENKELILIWFMFSIYF